MLCAFASLRLCIKGIFRTEWASHEDHDVQVSYEFTNGRKMTATGVKL
jgi:hypothetical protein